MHKDEFKKAAEKARGMSANAFIDLIKAERPDLAEEMAYAPSKGISSHTVIFSNEVFKTGRVNEQLSPEVQEFLILAIERERNILAHLQGKGLPVPQLTYTGKNLGFFGMTKMSGKSLSRWDIDNTNKAKLAKQIAALSVKLSGAVSEREAKAMGADMPFPNRGFQPDVLRAQLADPAVKKALGKNYDFLKRGVESYIDEHQKKYGDKLYFMHGDLLSGNIFFDRKTSEITALIDFGHSGLMLPENGFLGFSKEYPEDFVDITLKEYSRLQGVSVTRRDIQRWEAVLLLGTVARGLERNEPDSWWQMVKDGISAFHAEAKNLSAEKPQMSRREPALKAI